MEEKSNSIFIDGCFDLVHCGHFNAIRQAALLAPRLVVGVCSDEDIALTKGPPILNVHERCAIIESCKWVTQVERDTPYTPSVDVLDKFNCLCYAHGDDPCINSEGVDVCKVLQDIGRFKMIKRTTGVSTTDITGRLLRLVCKTNIAPQVKEAPR
jgi:ethanolamine-phosphate cytidylyltransferase